MEVMQFITQFNAKIKDRKFTDAEKINMIIKMLNVKPYIGIREKERVMKEVLSRTLTYDETKNKITYNSFERDLMIIITLIKTYTDLIDIDEEGYDLLCSSNLLEYVLGAFGKEYTICLGVMNTYIQDLELNRITLEDL